MSPEFRSLLWKEWLERRRLFKLGVGLMLLYLGYCVAYEIEYRTRAFAAAYYSTCLMFSWLASVLLAMTTATGEYTQRTLKFSSSLPGSLKQVAWARLLGAWGCLAGLIVIGALFATPLLASGFFEQAGLRGVDYDGTQLSLPDRPSVSRLEAVKFLWTVAAIAIVAAVHLVTLISLIGTYCRSEGTIGLLGAIIGLFFTALTAIRQSLDQAGLFLVSDWIGGLFPQSMAINWSYGELDGSSYADLELAPLILGPLVISTVITLALGQWFASRYGRRAESARNIAPRKWRFLPKGPPLLSRLGLRWPGQWAALVWLNARQSVPLCFAGLALAVLITLVGLMEQSTRGSVVGRLAGELPSSTWAIGLLWGAVVAVGIFAAELQPEREQFWRSRPISPAAWFWVKFFVGLIALLLTLDAIPALLTLSTSHRPDTGRIGIAYAACMPLLHTLTYAAAVAFVCRWRRAIPAAIAALMLFFAMDQILESIPVNPKLSTMNVFNQLETAEFGRQYPPAATANRVDLTTEGYPLVYGLVAAVIIGTTIFARRAVMSPVALKATLWAACFLCLGNVSHLMGAEPAETSQIVAGIRAREALIRDLHLRWSTKRVTTEDYARTIAAEQDAVSNRRRSRLAAPPAPTAEEKRYEYFDRPPKFRAWTEFNTDGSTLATTTYDGTVRRDFYGMKSRTNNGSITAAPQAPPSPPFSPEQLLSHLAGTGTSLPELFDQVPQGEVTRREAAGEQLIGWTGQRTITATENGSPVSYEHRYYVTLNATRNFWPVRLELEVVQSSDGRLASRFVTTTEDWIETGPIVFPKRIEQRFYLAPADRTQESAELLHSSTLECDVELAEMNAGIPDAMFLDPFPAGAIIYDFRDSAWHEIGPTGESSIYLPKPRGVRGAVLAYHLIWITAAGVYFFYWRPRSAQVS